MKNTANAFQLIPLQPTRRRATVLLTLLAILLALVTINYQLPASPAGTVFTYQGKLFSGGDAASGIYDLRFAIFDALSSGSQLGGWLTNSATAVTNGYFTVGLDFGNYFDGNARWLEIGVRTNGAPSFTTLSPRQQLTPTPYAILANSASNLLGALPISQLTGTVPLTQLPAAVLTNNESGVALGGLTLNGNLNLPTTTSGAGIIYSGGSPLIHDYGNNNFFAGAGAGNLSMSGGWNTGIGAQALQYNTSGAYNTGVGYEALVFNTIGGFNTANGTWALASNTSGSGNTAVGFDALTFNMTGSNNTAIGVSASQNNISGSYNTANGWMALIASTNGSANTAIGYEALYHTTTGSNNLALGCGAGSNLTTNNSNIDIGNAGAFSDNGVIRIGTPGAHTNTFIAGVLNGNGGGLTNLNAGQLSGRLTLAQMPASVLTNSEPAATLGSLTLIGNLNLPATTSGAGVIYSGGTPLIHEYGSDNFFAGTGAGNLTLSGGDNTGLGYAALHSETSGFENTAVGSGALNNNTSGNANTACGWAALESNTNGYVNTAVGMLALYANTSGAGNTAEGAYALRDNTSGQNNTAVGASALSQNTTAWNNTAVGSAALDVSNGQNNSAVGYAALGFNTSGGYNAADGCQALGSNTTGHDNTAIGYDALYSNTDGSGNIALGSSAGRYTSGNNSICIGNQGVAAESGVIRIGTPGTHTSTILSGNVGIGVEHPAAGLEVRAGWATAIYTSNILNSVAGALGYVGAGNVTSGVYGSSPDGINSAVYGTNTSTGAEAALATGVSAVYGRRSGGLAGNFIGNVQVLGTLSKSAGSFRIDHPLDPAHKYLSHSFVESPDMKDIYDGVVVLDGNGETVIQLPGWFEALNRDFRYQLTAMGSPGPNLHIAEEVSGNQFKIAGGRAGMKVSWQLTGIRQDAYANAHRIPVEEDKAAGECGLYLQPDLFGQPATSRVDEPLWLRASAPLQGDDHQQRQASSGKLSVH